MNTIISHERFQADDAVVLAPWLLGKTLVRARTGGGVSRHLITETEAYNGVDDKACHASKGRTARTEVMFRPGGVWYVYLCYGVHEMLNLVVGPEDFPAAVLIRGLHDVSGPGRLTKQLAIDRKLNGLAASPASGLHLEDDGIAVPKKWIQIAPRIGVDYAGPLWAKKPWRFTLDPRWPGLERALASAQSVVAGCAR
ncbi:MAG: DNA-3-methyladenine glycosylase [Verrucomicrobia bacterium]|nr:DNA-3-methyladenine glycosylase [Verrucomicrobiota bacterium]